MEMIYGITNSKGGVGKTTIAVHLAAYLAEKGRRVVFVDADPQQSAAAWIKELPGKMQLKEIESDRELIEKIPFLARQADDIVIDGPAGLSTATRAIMLRADRVFFPCGPSILDLRAVSKAILLSRQAQKSRSSALQAFLIPNKLQKRARLSREVLRAAEKLDLSILPGLSLRAAFADAPSQSAVVWKMGKGAIAARYEIEDLMKEMTND